MRLISVLIGASLFSVVSTANAADATIAKGGTLHFAGTVVNAPCVVDTANLKDIELGQVRTAVLKGAGYSSASKEFQIGLVDCDPTVSSSASVAFQGLSPGAYPNLLAVTGGAKGIGIEILDADNKTITPDGSNFSAKRTLSANNNVIKFNARYKSMTSYVTPGDANADVTFTLKYE